MQITAESGMGDVNGNNILLRAFYSYFAIYQIYFYTKVMSVLQ